MLLAENWKHEDCMVHVQVCHLFPGREAFVAMNKLPVFFVLNFFRSITGDACYPA